jgi:hypothetical protein
MAPSRVWEARWCAFGLRAYGFLSVAMAPVGVPRALGGLSLAVSGSLRSAPIVLYPPNEYEGADKGGQGSNCQRRMLVRPLMPVRKQNPYAGYGDAKARPYCRNGIPQPDCMPVFHPDMPLTVA